VHAVIRAIVHAADEEEALEIAEGVFENLCGEDRAFDYYTMFREKDTSSVSGRTRWGNLPAVTRADSPEGKQLIEEGMKYTRDEFMEDIKVVREALAVLSDEELFTEEPGPSATAAKIFTEANGERYDFTYDPHMVKYYMHHCGKYDGPGIYLYNEYGEGIRTPKEIKHILDDTEEGQEVFVVPADVHF